MGWADDYVGALVSGKTVQLRLIGASMTGRIDSGQLCTVEPIDSQMPLFVGDVVLCRVNGFTYLHLINAVEGDRYQIANNVGHVNGWTTRSKIFGRLVCVK
jgi:hypothetical protein